MHSLNGYSRVDLNTKDQCFICLKSVLTRCEKKRRETGSLSTLIRHLSKSDRGEFQSEFSLNECSFLNGLDMIVEFCGECSKNNKTIVELVRLIEISQMKLCHNLESLRRKIQQTTKTKMYRFRKRMKCDDSASKHLGPVNRLRKWISTACVGPASKFQPRVNIKRVVLDRESNINSSAAVPVPVPVPIPIYSTKLNGPKSQIKVNRTVKAKGQIQKKPIKKQPLKEKAVKKKPLKKIPLRKKAVKKKLLKKKPVKRKTIIKKRLPLMPTLEDDENDLEPIAVITSVGTLVSITNDEDAYNNFENSNGFTEDDNEEGAPEIEKIMTSTFGEDISGKDFDVELPIYQDHVTVPKNTRKLFKSKSGSRFRCQLCSRTYKEKRYLKQHFNDSHVPDNFRKCSRCRKTFRSRYYAAHLKKCILRSMKPKKPLNPAPVRTPISTSKIVKKTQMSKCTVCLKVFKNFSTLKQHVENIHLDIGRHACDHCDQKFYYIKQLERHQNLVHFLTRYSCIFPGCERSYTDKSNLQYHLKSCHYTKQKVHMPNLLKEKRK